MHGVTNGPVLLFFFKIALQYLASTVIFTILHLFGLNHTKLTYRFQGRDFRLTDVHGEVVKPLLT